MRKIIIPLLVLIIFSSFTVKPTTVVLPVNNLESTVRPGVNITISLEQIATMKIKEVEKIFGRKLSLKEKIVFKIAQYRIKKALKGQGNAPPSKGQTAFIISLIGLCLLIVPYAGIASLPLAIVGLVLGANAKKENPDDRKAQTAIILSIVTLGLIVLAILFVIALLASGGFWF